MPGDRTPGIDKEIERIAFLAKEWKYRMRPDCATGPPGGDKGAESMTVEGEFWSDLSSFV